jgi:hypothetical protein
MLSQPSRTPNSLFCQKFRKGIIRQLVSEQEHLVANPSDASRAKPIVVVLEVEDKFAGCGFAVRDNEAIFAQEAALKHIAQQVQRSFHERFIPDKFAEPVKFQSATDCV